MKEKSVSGIDALPRAEEGEEEVKNNQLNATFHYPPGGHVVSTLHLTFWKANK